MKCKLYEESNDKSFVTDESWKGQSRQVFLLPSHTKIHTCATVRHTSNTRYPQSASKRKNTLIVLIWMLQNLGNILCEPYPSQSDNRKRDSSPATCRIEPERISKRRQKSHFAFPIRLNERSEADADGCSQLKGDLEEGSGNRLFVTAALAWYLEGR